MMTKITETVFNEIYYIIPNFVCPMPCDEQQDKQKRMEYGSVLLYVYSFFSGRFISDEKNAVLWNLCRLLQ